MVGDIAKEMCNKPSTFYWLQSAQIGAPDAHEKSYMSSAIFTAMFEAWYRSSVHPNIEFGQRSARSNYSYRPLKPTTDFEGTFIALYPSTAHLVGYG